MGRTENNISLSEFVKREISLLQKFLLNAPDDLKTASLSEEDWLEQFDYFNSPISLE